MALARLDRPDEAARELELSAHDPALAARAHQILQQMRGETPAPLPPLVAAEGAAAGDRGVPPAPPLGLEAGQERVSRDLRATPEMDPREEEAHEALSERTFLIASTEALLVGDPGDPHTILDPMEADQELPREGEEEAAAS
jgi:hypothetical protein